MIRVIGTAHTGFACCVAFHPHGNHLASVGADGRVKVWDLRLFVTEWRDLMGNAPHPDWDRYRDVEPLARTIVPHASWQRSAETLLVLWRRVLPVYCRGAA